MAKVFISHAGKDWSCAGQLREWLVGEGHEVFLDQHVRDGLMVGEDWDQRLHERLRRADAVVCVVTPAYVASPWCSAEVGIAVSRGSRVLPVRARPRAVHPLLPAAHYADLTEDPGWPDDRSSFPGLRPFDVGQHRAFFGSAHGHQRAR